MNDGKIRMGYEGREQARQASVGDDLWQLHAAAAKIAEFTAGSSAQDFATHEVLRAAVERMLALMAEAYTRLCAADFELSAKFGGGPALTELAGRLEPAGGMEPVGGPDQTGGAVPSAEVWSFVRATLPGLIGTAQEELERWHQG